MDKNIQSNFKEQEIVKYYLQGIYNKSKIFSDQKDTPYADELTLDDSPHSITNFLRRPIDIYNFKWSVNNAVNTELIPGGLKFPDVLLKSQSVKDKLRNFVGMKGKLMLRIKINPQPYQQGVLLAYYIPNAQKISQKVSMIQASLSGKTGCPGNVCIDAQGGTMYDIEIPYVSEFNYYGLLTGQGSYGNFYFTPLLKLSSKTANDFINITIQAYWIDPQPQFTTGVDMKVPTESEEQQLHSNTLETGGNQHVSKMGLIDTLQTDAIKPSTVLKTGANLLQLAGYQKPNIETGICQSHLQTNKFMANYNGEQFSHSMALSSTNKLEHPPFPTSTEEDEMNLRNIWMKSTYYRSFTWTTSNSKGDILYHDEIYPAKFSPSETSNVLNSTFLGYATAPFTQWKGSIVVKGRLAKTQYHSGSIRISWCPGLYDTDFNANNIVAPNFNMNMNYSVVIDIKENNEFTYVIPYTTVAPALANVNPYSLQSKVIAKHNWCCGSIVIDVFSDLVANQTIVVPTIDFAIFMSGGADLEMMGATSPNVFPYYPAVATEGVSEVMDERSEESNESLQPITGRLKDTYLSSALLTGECVTSVKNFLGRQALYASIDGVTATNTIKISPFDFQRPLSAITANITNFDFLDYFSFIYGWYAGGVNLSMYCFSDTISRYYEIRSLPGLNAYYPDSFPRASALTLAENNSYMKTLALLPIPTQVVKSDLEGMAHIMVPYYNRVQITPALTQPQTVDLTEEGSYPSPIIYIQTPRAFSNTRIFRAATDSFQFYYLLGPPQVVLLSGSAQLNPFIYPNVLINKQKQTVTDQSGGTLRVSPFFQNDSLDFVGTTSISLTPNTFFLSRYKTNPSDPWSLMVTPGGDSYDFTLASGDMRISKTGVILDTWNLLNGAFTRTVTGTQTTYHVLSPIELSDSKPIKRSVINSTSSSFGTTCTVPGINNGLSFPANSPVLVTNDSGILAFRSSSGIPLIIPKGETVSIGSLGSISYRGPSLSLIASFANDVKYTAGLAPEPYILNDSL